MDSTRLCKGCNKRPERWRHPAALYCTEQCKRRAAKRRKGESYTERRRYYRVTHREIIKRDDAAYKKRHRAALNLRARLTRAAKVGTHHGAISQLFNLMRLRAQGGGAPKFCWPCVRAEEFAPTALLCCLITGRINRLSDGVHRLRQTNPGFTAWGLTAPGLLRDILLAMHRHLCA
jgi:hypothetical protein